MATSPVPARRADWFLCVSAVASGVSNTLLKPVYLHSLLWIVYILHVALSTWEIRVKKKKKRKCIPSNGMKNWRYGNWACPNMYFLFLYFLEGMFPTSSSDNLGTVPISEGYWYSYLTQYFKEKKCLTNYIYIFLSCFHLYACSLCECQMNLSVILGDINHLKIVQLQIR